MSDIIRETERLHLVYAFEIKKKQDKFDAAMKKLADEEKAINATDYVKEYVDTYRVSLSALEEIFADWDSVQRRTKGVTFTVGEYIKRLSPRPVPRGGVFEYVDRLVEEGRAAIMEVDGSKTVEGDIAPQKRFCQCLTDLRYVVMSSRRLLAETGYEERKREEALAEVDKKKADLEFNFKKNTKLENLSCYKELEALKTQILTDNEKANTMLIGKPLSDEETDYRFLIGFKKSDINKDALKFAVDVLGVPEKALSGVPVFFEPKTRNGVLFVKADSKMFKRSKTSVYGDKYGIMRNFYFALASGLKPVNLRLCCAETAFSADLKALTDSVKNKLGEERLFDKGIAKTYDECRNLLEALQKLSSDRLSEYSRAADETGRDIQSIYDFNAEKPDGKQGFVLAMLNYLPDCMDVSRGNDLEVLKDVLITGPSVGIYFLVRIDSSNNDFDLSDVDADVMELLDDGSVVFNGDPISVDVEIDDFKPVDFYAKLKESLKEGNSLPLKKLISESEKRFEKAPISDYNKALQIPLGISGGEWYDFTIKTCSQSVFGLFTGTTGSGKSFTMHSFILSASYFYAPDELELYLVDFKNSGESPEFAAYKKDGGPLYVPHVKYLSLKNSSESAMDLLNKIEFMRNERNNRGCRDITVYNSSEAVKTGKEKKMPIALFLIDEYNQMFKNIGDDVIMENALKKKLADIVKTARTAGIEIIFFGQDVSSLISDSLGQMGLRMSLTVNEERVLTDLFQFKEYRESSFAMDKLSEKGMALISTDGGKEKSFVKLAYCGTSDSKDTVNKQTLEIAAKIREKYKNNPGCNDIQVVAGSDEKFNIGEFEKLGGKIGEYHLPIGVSASNTLPVSLEYSLEKSTVGYMAYSNDEEKLFEIERSAMLSFMYKYPMNSGVIYCSNLVDNKAFFKGFGSKESFIRSLCSECADRYSTACEVEKLYEIYEERTEAAEVSEEKPSPIFFVLHDFEWLTGRGKINPPKTAEPEVEEETVDVVIPSDEEVQGLAALQSAGILGGAAAGLLGASMSIPLTAPTKKKREEYKEYEIADVWDKVLELYEKANRVGIFVLLSNETESAVSDVLSSDTSEAKPFASHVVYGSYGLKIKGKEDGSKNCVFVSTVNSRTRLFDYSVEKNAEWWKALKAKRG